MTLTRERLPPLPDEAVNDLLRIIDLIEEISGNDPRTGVGLLLFTAACICRDKKKFLAEAARCFDLASSKNA